MSNAEQFHVDEVSSTYWRVTFGNGPVNLLDPASSLLGCRRTSPPPAVVGPYLETTTGHRTTAAA